LNGNFAGPKRRCRPLWAWRRRVAPPLAAPPPRPPARTFVADEAIAGSGGGSVDIAAVTLAGGL